MISYYIYHPITVWFLSIYYDTITLDSQKVPFVFLLRYNWSHENKQNTYLKEVSNFCKKNQSFDSRVTNKIV